MSLTDALEFRLAECGITQEISQESFKPLEAGAILIIDQRGENSNAIGWAARYPDGKYLWYSKHLKS